MPIKNVLPVLTSRQKGILADITHLLKSVEKYDGRAWHSLTEREEKDLVTQYGRYEQLMLQACRAGLEDHSRVRGWVRAMRSLGARDLLRRARRGLEKGIKRPIPLRDIELRDTIEQLQKPPAPRMCGRSLEAIRRLLIKQGTIAPMTQQAFNKLVSRLNTVEGSLTTAVGQTKAAYRFQTTEKSPGVLKVRLREEPTRKPPKKR